MRKSLSDLVAGDTALWYSGHSGEPVTVTRVTKTLIETTKGTFKLRDGSATRFSFGSIRNADETEYAEAKDDKDQKVIGRRFNEMDWRKLPVETLRQVNAILGNA